MSIREKLDQYEKNQNGKLNEDEMKDLFGKNFREKLITGSFSNAFEIVFEEDGRLFITSFIINDRDILGHIDARPYDLGGFGISKLLYKEIDDKKLQSIYQEYEDHKKQINVLESILHHKNYRIKSLFHKK